MNRRQAMKAAATTPLLGAATAATGNPMPVADLVRSQGVATTWARLQELAATEHGWRVLARRAAYPECLLDTLHDMGLHTVGQVEACVATLNALPPQAADGLFPHISIPNTTPLLDAIQIDFAAKGQFSLTRQIHGDWADYRFDHADRAYQTLTLATARDLAKRFPYRSAEFWRSANCEDLVPLLRAWVIQCGCLNAAIGLAGLDLFRAGTRTVAHAVPFAVLDNRQIVLLDAGRVLPAGLATFAGVNATSYKLRWLLMV